MAAHQPSEMLHTNSYFVSSMVVSHVASLLFIDFIKNILSFVSVIDLMIVVSPPIYLASSLLRCIKSV